MQALLLADQPCAACFANARDNAPPSAWSPAGALVGRVAWLARTAGIFMRQSTSMISGACVLKEIMSLTYCTI